MKKDNYIRAGLGILICIGGLINIKLRGDRKYLKGYNDALEKCTKDIEKRTEELEEIRTKLEKAQA